MKINNLEPDKFILIDGRSLEQAIEDACKVLSCTCPHRGEPHTSTCWISARPLMRRQMEYFSEIVIQSEFLRIVRAQLELDKPTHTLKKHPRFEIPDLSLKNLKRKSNQ